MPVSSILYAPRMLTYNYVLGGVYFSLHFISFSFTSAVNLSGFCKEEKKEGPFCALVRKSLLIHVTVSRLPILGSINICIQAEIF